MRIGLIDVDGHHYPNLPLMKLSSWHKARGDTVEWYNPMFSGHLDRVYMSKVFSFSPDYEYCVDADEIVKGGTGYAITLEDGKERYNAERDPSLPEGIEHSFPDYWIYGITDTAYGFTSRGCPRGCAFCHVAAKEGRCSRKVADLDEWWNGQKYIMCCDPNILACKDKTELLNQYAESGARVNFNQGLDIRLMTGTDIDALRRIKLEKVHYAWDNPSDDLEQQFRDVSESSIGGGKSGHGTNGTVYCLTNFEQCSEQEHADRLLYRIYKLRSMGFQPFVMIYDKAHSPKLLKRIARWCNNPFVFWSTERFEEYRG